MRCAFVTSIFFEGYFNTIVRTVNIHSTVATVNKNIAIISVFGSTFAVFVLYVIGVSFSHITFCNHLAELRNDRKVGIFINALIRCTIIHHLFYGCVADGDFTLSFGFFLGHSASDIVFICISNNIFFQSFSLLAAFKW